MTEGIPAARLTVPPPADLPSRSRRLGILMVGGAATCFALSAIMGRIAFDGGSDPVTVIAGRFVVGFLALLALVKAAGLDFTLPRHKLIGSVWIGIAITASSLCYCAAIHLIPISLAVLIFYTFPILVGVAARFTENEPLTPGKIAALLAAFVGVAIALNVRFDGLNPWGLLLACGPAIAIGGTTLFSGRVLADGGVRTMNAYMMGVGTVITLIAVAIQGGPTLPETGLGWLGFFGVALFFVMGNLLYFSAFRRVRAVDIAMALNMEPVTAIAFAVLLLGEILSPLQYAGAAMVVGAVLAMTALRR